MDKMYMFLFLHWYMFLCSEYGALYTVSVDYFT